MNVSPTFIVSNRPVFVIDDAVDLATIERIAAKFSGAHFARTESDRADTKHVRSFALDVPLDGWVRDEPLFRVLENAVATTFPGADLTPYRAYVNCMVYGDMAYPHRDCHPERFDVTTLVYVNRDWHQDWAGETVFFDDDHEARVAVAPRPGRVVIFHGAIEHRAGVPARLCLEERLSLAYKFKSPGEWR
jgi:hypothetical protein